MMQLFELGAQQESAQFWTADKVLLEQLSPRAIFVHQLGE